MNEEVDGYELFFNFFSEITNEKMIQFGLDSLKSCDTDIATKEWDILKDQLLNNNELHIRGYGRDAKSTCLYFHLYERLFNNNKIKKDASNNHHPTKRIERWTKNYKKPNKTQLTNGCKVIQNFQVSHVFGQTKNPLLFLSPWNIIFLPKVMDPFTGHESKGDLSESFSEELRSFIYNKYKPLIEDYNLLSKGILNKIEPIIDKMQSNSEFQKFNLIQFRKDALSEWDKIEI